MLQGAELRACVVEMIRMAETRLPSDVVRALERSKRRESDRIARLQLGCMLENLSLAKKTGAPICQDTGTFTFFVELDPRLDLGFDLRGELKKGVERATREVPLRGQMVDPISREASGAGDGIPIRIELGRKGLRIDLLVKGSGAENWSRLHMLKPTAGSEAIKKVVLDTIAEAGGQPCPPTTVGVGVGGSAERACAMAERALLRPLDLPNPDPRLGEFERELCRAANGLGIGPMGLGGRTTVLGVHVLKAPCHTASLPVAIGFQCWAARRASASLSGKRLKIWEPR